jgi:hypothetical protein
MMKVVVAFLNVFSKGAFTFYLIRVRDDLKLREKLKAGQDILDMKEASELEFLPSNELSALVQETLASMGRTRDLDAVMDIIRRNMITTPDDVLVLTKQYCSEIGLPWAFVFAFKDKWRRGRAHKSDAWSLKNDLRQQDDGMPMVSPAAPHVALNPHKLDKVLSQRIDRSDRQTPNDGGSDVMTPRENNPDAMGYEGTSMMMSGASGTGQVAILTEQLAQMRRQREAETADMELRIKEKMQSMMSDQVNRTVMDAMNKNLKKQREDGDDDLATPSKGAGYSNGY